MRFRSPSYAHCELEDGLLACTFPYDPAFITALKARIPASDRKWDADTKRWNITPKHAPVLRELVAQILGETLVLPAVKFDAPRVFTKTLVLKYIGQTKDRGNDERQAYGYVEGAWTVIFPESVLRTWFNAPGKPEEAPSLYATLGVLSNVSGADLRTAYRRLARQWHPDVCTEPDAQAQFVSIQHAWELLSDPSKRARYDAGLLLAATVAVPKKVMGTGRFAKFATVPGYRPPLRCGLLKTEGVAHLDKFVISRIISWDDIVQEGHTLSTSWPPGAAEPVERWL